MPPPLHRWLFAEHLPPSGDATPPDAFLLMRPLSCEPLAKKDNLLIFSAVAGRQRVGNFTVNHQPFRGPQAWGTEAFPHLKVTGTACNCH